MLVVAFIINLIIIVLECFVLWHIKGKLNILKYYTYLQNFLCLLVSLIFVIYFILNLASNKEIPEFVRGLRYIATCGLLATMFIFIVFLGAGKKISITEEDFLFGFSPKTANIILHYICPLLSLISFIIFERELLILNGIWTAVVAIPSCLYWVVYLILSSTKLWNEPYNFSSQGKKSTIIEVLTFTLIPLSFILISFILWNVK